MAVGTSISTLILNDESGNISGNAILKSDKNETMATLTASGTLVPQPGQWQVVSTTSEPPSDFVLKVKWPKEAGENGATGSAAGTYNRQTYDIPVIPVAVGHGGKRPGEAGA